MNRSLSARHRRELNLGSCLILILLILQVDFSTSFAEGDDAVVGRIDTCWECQLHKYPILADFLFAGDADCYKNIHVVEYAGTPPSLTVFKGGVGGEKIELMPFDTKEKLHQLFQDQGLTRKSLEDCDEVFRKKKIERAYLNNDNPMTYFGLTPEVEAQSGSGPSAVDNAEL
jgi:Sep15/SelM redox domain